MPQLEVIHPATAAVAAKAIVRVPGAHTSVVLSADKLAGVEEADIFVMSGNTWVTATDGEGAALKLTATDPVIRLAAGPTYGVTKDATATACGIYADPL